MSKITIHNVETGEIIEREMTASELEKFEADQLAAAETKVKIATAKADLLEKLGITEEEAKLLLS